QYTGQAWLPELAMYHYKARIYSPTLGRFLQTDPIGYEDQVNLYAYVANDPVNHTDPTGMYELPQWLANLFAAGAPPPSDQQVQQGGGDYAERLGAGIRRAQHQAGTTYVRGTTTAVEVGSAFVPASRTASVASRLPQVTARWGIV
ncbi:MAG: RHS repeat-associated core domain-containing protein, partial [Pseudomonadota bacterium]|nr:RHS repeat-associated core domain-containing protein [Pseudomonadota bacterium]